MRLLTLGLLIFLPFGLFAQKKTLTIEVSNLKSLKGQVILNVFNSAKGYPMKTEHAFLRKVITIPKSGKVVFKVEELEAGEYAFVIIHDENNNNKIDLNFIGIPIEAAGASNNATGFMSPPSYKSARFYFNRSMKVNIKMLYF